MVGWLVLVGCRHEAVGGKEDDRPEAADSGADSEVGPPQAWNTGPACASGWCWEAPTPSGEILPGLVALGPDEVWASTGNARYRWMGGEWEWLETGEAGEDPWGTIWGSSSTDVWAAAWGGLRHWDGHAWSDEGPQSLVLAIHGRASDDVWAITADGLSHHDGVDWVDVELPAAAFPVDVWAVAPGQALVVGWYDAWLVTASGVLDLGLPPAESAYAVAGVSPDDLWVLGESGLLHKVGDEWTQAASGTFTDLWAIGADDVWAAEASAESPSVLQHWNGTSLDVVDFPGFIPLRVTGEASGSVWVADANGAVRHWAGGTWTSLKEPASDLPTAAISVRADGTGLAACGSTLLARDPDGTWAPTPPPATESQFTGVWSTQDADYVSGSSGSYRRAAGAWETLEGASWLTRGCETDDGRVWGLSIGSLAELVGSTWVWQASGDFTSLVCSGGEAWATGFGDQLHYDGDWALAPHGFVAVEAVGGERLAVDDHASVYREVDGEWETVHHRSETIAGAVIDGPDDVWAVDGDHLYRFGDGSQGVEEHLSVVLGSALVRGGDGRKYAGGWFCQIVGR